MRLVLVELDRFRSRRAIALIVVAAFAFAAWMTVDTIWNSRPVSSTEIAAAKEQAAQEAVQMEAEYERCLEDPAAWGGPAFTAEMCERYESDYRFFLARAPLSLEEERDDTGKVAVILLAGLAIIIGATYAGADWATGSMSNQMLFRPRRLQVWTAKAVAVVVGVTVAAAVVLALMWSAYVLTAELRDIGHSPDFLRDLGGFLARGLALVAGGGLGGYALTMLLRSTVGTLAVLFAYTVGGEALVATLPIDRVTRLSPSNNVWAWLDHGTSVYDDSIQCSPSADFCEQTYTLSLTHGAFYLFGLLALVVVASALVFRRRDIP